MDTTVIENKKEKSLFKNDSKGNILFLGSGKYFREQKERYSEYSEPYKQLYKEQVKAIIKEASEEVRSVFVSL